LPVGRWLSRPASDDDHGDEHHETEQHRDTDDQRHEVSLPLVEVHETLVVLPGTDSRADVLSHGDRERRLG
jgi:hypothetical protein